MVTVVVDVGAAVVVWVVVPIVEVEFPALGSRHEQSVQYWVFILGPQQSPPS